MKKANVLRSIMMAAGTLAVAALPANLAAATYSAGGTHQCKASDGAVYSCVVSGTIYGDCVSASSSLQTQDCCRSARACARDSQGRETNCRGGGSSVGFTMNYCIQGRP